MPCRQDLPPQMQGRKKRRKVVKAGMGSQNKKPGSGAAGFVMVDATLESCKSSALEDLLLSCIAGVVMVVTKMLQECLVPLHEHISLARSIAVCTPF